MSNLNETIEAANIREFKLTNGQTIIGELMGVHEQNYVLYDPYIIDASTQVGTAVFRRWYIGAEEELQYLKEEFVMSHAKCRYEVKEAYIKNAMEEKLIDQMEDDPDNYEFYADSPEESDIVH